MNHYSDWESMEKDLFELVNEKVFVECGGNSIDKDLDLVDSRTLSSLSLINLLSEIEDKIDINLLFEDVSLEDFTTINKIVQSVKKSYEAINGEMVM